MHFPCSNLDDRLFRLLVNLSPKSRDKLGSWREFHLYVCSRSYLILPLPYFGPSTRSRDDHWHFYNFLEGSLPF